MLDLNSRTLQLTPEETAVLNGSAGPSMQKVMATVVLYGEVLGADRLLDITGAGHFVITYALPGIAPSLPMLEELVAAGLKTMYPFTLDPRPPLDCANWFLRTEQKDQILNMYANQARYDQMMHELGLQSEQHCTCTPASSNMK